MGIDRIGKGGAPPATPDAGAVEKKGPVDKAFSIDRPEATSRTAETARTDAAGGSDALARLRAGEIDVDRYVDLKVDEATKGLDGLSPAELADVKQIVREQMVTDPGLADLVRAATGQIPKPPEE